MMLVTEGGEGGGVIKDDGSGATLDLEAQPGCPPSFFSII